MLGQILDRRYQVVQVLADEEFSQTYVAQDPRRPGCPSCVVKHLKPVSNDPVSFETAKCLFNSEAATLEQLGHHDRIPRLLAHFEENQEFYLVQELVEGHTLSAELIPGQRWSENQVMGLLQEVLVILEFVHHQEVIHRDIKPDNIIRRQRDRELVLVFGAVKLRTQPALAQIQPSATVAIGTPGYMPTEQGQGNPRPNSDIYALGMVGIQALIGCQPMQLEADLNTGEILWQHLVPVSPGLGDVLTKMVRYHFKDRYQTATEALQALQALPFVSLSQPGVGYIPNGAYPLQHSTIPHSAQLPSQQHTIPVAPVFAANLNPSAYQNQNAGSSSRDLLPLLVGVGVSVVVVAAGIVVSRSAQTTFGKSSANVTSTQCFATISPYSNIRSEPTSTNPDNIIQSASNLPNQLRLPVTGVRTKGGWLEVKSPKSLAWASLAVVANRGELESCLKASGIPIQTVADSTFASRSAVPDPTNNNSVAHPAGQKPNATRIDEPQASDHGMETLARATEKYQSGDLKGAIALLKSISSSSAAFNKAAGAITQWQQDWAKAEAELNDIRQAVNENRWDKVLAHQAANPNIKYWRDRIIQRVKEAAKKKAIQLRLPKLTVSSNSTNAPTPAVRSSSIDATNPKHGSSN